MATIIVVTPATLLAKNHPQSWIQHLRKLLNIAPIQAVAGTRAGVISNHIINADTSHSDGSSVCLLSPISITSKSGNTLLVGVSRPVLWTAQPLNELVLMHNGKTHWRSVATTTHPITGPIAWPVQPLKTGDAVTLRLRVAGSDANDFIEMRLLAADTLILRQGDRLAQVVSTNSTSWISSFRLALSKGDRLTMALLLSSSWGGHNIMSQIDKSFCQMD